LALQHPIRLHDGKMPETNILGCPAHDPVSRHRHLENNFHGACFSRRQFTY
jgi:hypothetical protein